MPKRRVYELFNGNCTFSHIVNVSSIRKAISILNSRGFGIWLVNVTANTIEVCCTNTEAKLFGKVLSVQSGYTANVVSLKYGRRLLKSI